MALQILTAVRNSMLEAIRTAGGAGGSLVIYTGTSPGVNVAATGTLLVTLPIATTFAAAAASGAMTITTPTTTAVSSAGTLTAGYFRVLGATSNVLFDGTVGTTGADLNFSTVSFSNGANISITAPFTITAGNP